MKTRKQFSNFLFTILILISIIGIVQAFILTTFSNGDTVTQLSFNNTNFIIGSDLFSGNYTLLRNLTIPASYIYNINASMNVSSTNIGENLCFQETANVSTSCGGSSQGYYTHSPPDLGSGKQFNPDYYFQDSYVNDSYIYDGNYSSYGIVDQSSTGNMAGIFIVYKKPANASSLTWQIKDGQNFKNVTVSGDSGDYCWYTNKDYVYFVIKSSNADAPPGGYETSWWCVSPGNAPYNSSISQLSFYNTGFTNNTVVKVYEESVYWNMTNYVLQPTVKVGSNTTFFFPGKLSQSNNKTDITAYVREYLSTNCDPDVACTIPITYLSTTPGLMNSTIFFSANAVQENGQNYNNQTFEGSLENFIINVTLPGTASLVMATLVYNGTRYSGTIDSDGLNSIITRGIFVPGVSVPINVSFHWELNLSTGASYSSANALQQINPISIDNCTTNTNRILNFTVRDEEFKTFITNATIETAVNIYNGDRSSLLLNASGTFGNPASICLGSNINNTNYSLDTIVRYKATDYANEFYNIANFTINNNTGTQNIILYDLNESDSTEFQLTFAGPDNLPSSGALVYLERRYIAENQFKTVELPVTDSNGQAILHMVRNDVLYNIRIIKNGEVIGLFEGITAFCEDFVIGNCKIILSAQDSGDDLFDYNEALGITFTGPEYSNSTNLVSFSFATKDGSTRNIMLEVTRSNELGNRTLCSSNIISSSGSISCNATVSTESLIIASVYVDDELSIIKRIQLGVTNLGAVGYLILFVFVLDLILMFSGSKGGVLFAILLGIGGGIGLGIFTGTIYGIGASGIWVILIVLIGIWKLNKEKIQ